MSSNPLSLGIPALASRRPEDSEPTPRPKHRAWATPVTASPATYQPPARHRRLRVPRPVTALGALLTARRASRVG